MVFVEVVVVLDDVKETVGVVLVVIDEEVLVEVMILDVEEA